MKGLLKQYFIIIWCPKGDIIFVQCGHYSKVEPDSFGSCVWGS